MLASMYKLVCYLITSPLKMCNSIGKLEVTDELMCMNQSSDFEILTSLLKNTWILPLITRPIDKKKCFYQFWYDLFWISKSHNINYVILIFLINFLNFSLSIKSRLELNIFLYATCMLMNQMRVKNLHI